ncbi:hypothetical protein L873DRAFT_709299 [Choiromyces venosus 120613-1]|uniref:Rad21/Rec8-like protein N-terminal domain-containing protein n=1 Tax=Choiromyces venosus 120613-1 TaxID=1336337 RepID=A0A3N4IXV4_9PEZI|nr:hypothetical protein L873DRAFT_709299 [Choiromyces venosus 120613-1]
MFFSPEYLTSRLYGVGTVWLAATVGTHNIHHKISRKDIMAVQIPAACQSFIEPDVPLALRFQSNLLCGVVRRSHTAAQARVNVDNINLTHGNLRSRALFLKTIQHLIPTWQLTFQCFTQGV